MRFDAFPSRSRIVFPGATHAYLCVHLANGGSGLGVSYVATDQHPWPNLVCNACADAPAEERLNEPLRVVAGSCWDDAFGRNTKVRNARPDAWLTRAFHHGHSQHHRWAKVFGVAPRNRWDLDLGSRPPWLGLGPAGGDRIEIGCQPVVIGTWDSHTFDWLWAWGNPHLPLALTRFAIRLKRLGERLGIEQLWRSRFPADEHLAANLSFVALASMRGCSGVFRLAQPNGVALFVAVRDPKRLDPTVRH